MMIKATPTAIGKRGKVDLARQADRCRQWFNEAVLPADLHARHAIKWEGYYYGDGQLTSDERWELAQRGQPDTVFNEVGPAVDLMLGTERRSRTEAEYLPRGQADEEKCRILMAASRQVADENATRYEVSDAFQDAALTGIGWLYQGLNTNLLGPRIKEQHIPWEQMLVDPNFTRTDLADARYIIRHLWHRAEEILAWMPGKKKLILDATRTTGLLAPAALRRFSDEFSDGPGQEDDTTHYSVSVNDVRAWNTADWLKFDNPDDPMVNVAECWYRSFERGTYLRDPVSSRLQEFDPADPTPEQVYALMRGAEVVEGPINRVRYSIFVGPALLLDEPSPYKHGEFPYTPIIAWRNRRTKRFYGVVARMVDPQDILNRTFAKLYHTMATRQIWIETGAAKDIDALEVDGADPGAVIELNPGGLDKFKIVDGGDRIRQYQSMMLLAKQFLSDNSGINDEMFGRQSNARTGAAIDRKIERGETTLGPLFDNKERFEYQIERKRLSLIQQYMGPEDLVRITDDPAGVRYARLGDGGSYNETLVDIVFSRVGEKASVRQGMAQAMMEMTKGLPEDMARLVLPLVIEMTDIPKKQQFIEQIQQANQLLLQQPLNMAA